MKVKVAQLCPTLCNPVDCTPPGSSVYGDSPGNNTGVGCHALLQGIFPTQESNPGLLHCRQFLNWLSYEGRHAAAAAKLLQSCPTLRPHRRQPTRLPRPWDSPGKNTAVGCHFLLHEGSHRWCLICYQWFSVLNHTTITWKAFRMTNVQILP